MSESGRVLVVDDEPFLAELVGDGLRAHGFSTEVTGSVAGARAAVQRRPPDLMVLDVLLGEQSGLDLCRELRAAGRWVPVLFLTARDGPADRVAGFSVGGDDYLTKPFGMAELVLRIRAVLRRTRGAGPPAVLRMADLELDETAHEVRRGGDPVRLTPTEFALLRLLLTHPRQVLTKRQILDQVWQYDFGGNDAVVQTYVSTLRAKIDRGRPPLIHTVPRVGYVLRTQE